MTTGAGSLPLEKEALVSFEEADELGGEARRLHAVDDPVVVGERDRQDETRHDLAVPDDRSRTGAADADLSAQMAAARRLASWERRYGSSALTLASSPMRMSAVMIASRTRGTSSEASAAASAGTASAWPPSARAALHRVSGPAGSRQRYAR